MRLHASYDEACISYVYHVFESEIYVILNEKWKIYKCPIRSDMEWMNSWDKLLLYNSIVSTWYHSLDDKSVCSVCSLRVKLNIDLSFSEMRKLYWIKFKKSITHRQRKHKEELEKINRRNSENFRNLSRNFQFECCGSSDNPSAFIEKRKHTVNG